MSRTPTSPAAVRVVSGLVLALGSALAIVACVMDARPWFGASLPVSLVVSAVLVWTHVRPERAIAPRGGVQSIQLDTVVLVPLLLFAGPVGALLATALGAVAGGVVARRAPVKVVFNLGQLLIGTSLAVALVGRFGGGRSPATPIAAEDLLLGMGAALLVEVVSTIAVSMMVAFVTATALRAFEHVVAQLVPWTGAILLGGVGAAAAVTSPVVAILAICLVGFVHRAYVSWLTDYAARRRAEGVQRAIASLRAQTSSATVRRELLAVARDLMGADQARLTGSDEDKDPPGSVGVPLGDGRLVVSGRQGAGTWSEEDRATLATLAGVASDVRRATELIEQLRAITTSQSEGLIALDMESRVTLVNPSAGRLLGVDPDEVADQHVDDILSVSWKGQRVDFQALLQRGLACAEMDGDLATPAMPVPLAISYTVAPMVDGEKQVGAVLVFRDTTERRALQQKLTHQAFHDELTGLPNRRRLLERLDKALARAQMEGTHHGLLFFDLDRFKRVNDSYGHAAGDDLLTQVAERVRSHTRANEMVARLSGDEFVVLVEDVAGPEMLTAAADRLVDVLAKPFEIRRHEVAVSASIGIVLSQPGDDREQMLAAADGAAYQAKRNGRNCHYLWERKDADAARASMQLESGLRQAVEQGELEVHYQPLFDTAPGTTLGIVRGVEALVRWRRPGHGLVAPGAFISMAEETGMITAIDRWVLADACRTVQRWTTQFPEREPLTVAVNLSARQFDRPRLAEEVGAVLQSSGLAASQLCLEITESAMMADTPSTLRTLAALRDLGVQVAIDDFGTGYSSLSYLKSFPVDAVKIDQSFVREIGQSRADTEIVAAVVRLASALGMDVIAEGVETMEQKLHLSELGCSKMQGYLLAQPSTADTFVQFWTETASAA